MGSIADRVARRVGAKKLRRARNDNFHDYATWLRQEPARTALNAVLTNPSSIYPEYIDRKNVVEDWRTHQSGGDRSRRIFQYLTFEIWLQQVFNGKFRKGMNDTDDFEELSSTSTVLFPVA